MSAKLLNRDDAPFSESTWAHIDEVLIHAARSKLSGRRVLNVEGPYGPGVKAIPGPDRYLSGSKDDGVRLSVSQAFPLVEIQRPFAIASRDIDAFEASGMGFDPSAIAAAAIDCAQHEDQLVFYGNKDAGVSGLFNAPGVQSHKLKSSEQVGAIADDIIAAVTKLDDNGFHGPYTVALAPSLYNKLFRRYAQGNQTEMDHVKSIVTDGVVKAPILKSGGVLLASGVPYAGIVIGQDLAAGFIGPEGRSYELFAVESLTVRLNRPDAVCVLK